MIFNPHLKLFYHGDRIKEWLEVTKTTPILIEIAPTGYCNANCSFCFFKDKRSNAKINKRIMIRTLQDMAIIGVKAINWTGGGEPTLHPDFKEFVQIANRLGFKQGLFTNAYNEIEQLELFEWIRITLTDEGFKKVKKPKVPFGICINQVKSQKEKDLKKLCLETKKFGASYFQIRPALIGSYKKQSVLNIPEYLKQYETKNFKVYVTPYKYEQATKERDYDKCYGYHFCPSIDWKGRLGTCLYMMNDSKFIFGNLNKDSFIKIWGKIPEYIKVSEECQNCCKNHEINRILFQAKKIEHKEFL